MSDARRARGTRIGPYEIESELGRGANGVVYRARDVRLERAVALKTFTGVASEEALERFVREARAVARLRHPGIVALHGAEIHGGVRVLALELVEGGSLKQLLEAKGKLPGREAAALLRDLALAVEAAHRAGIVHRDLKPANVLLEPDGRPRLTDFGLAHDENAAALTGTGDVLGTPAYMAPEQALARKDAIGPATDVWGLGAILYQTVSGQPPFPGRTALEVVKRVLERDPAPPGAVHRDLVTICMKALEKDPARRYASAGAFAEDLRRFLENEPIAARPIGLLERTRRRLARSAARTVLVTLAVVLLLGLGGVMLQAALQRRRARAEVAETLASLVASRLEDASVEAAVLQLTRNPDPELVLALGEELDRTSAELLAVARRSLLAAEALPPGAPIAGLAPAVERFLAASDGARLDRVSAIALGAAEARLLAEEARRIGPDPAERRPSLRELVARAQGTDVPPVRLALARVACEALGRIGRLEGLEPLGRHLDAEQDELRAVHPARALLRLRSFEGVRRSLRACDRFGRYGRFSDRLSRELADVRLADSFTPRTAVEFRDRGDLGAAANKLDEALADYERATALDPRDASAWESRGSILAQKGQVERALADFTRAIELDPSAARFGRRGNARLRWGDVDGAIADGTKAIAVARDDAEGWSLRGFSRIRKGDADGAIEDCTRAIELDPRHAAAYMNRGTAYRMKGDLEQATADGTRATELDPGDAQAWVNLGLTSDARREGPLAIAHMTRAIELDQHLAEAWAARGTARMTTGEWKLAEEDFGRALKEDPRLRVAWITRATLRHDRGDLEGAMSDSAKAIELDPKNHESWQQRALLRYVSRDYAGALSDCERAIELAPDDPALWRLRAFVRGASGDVPGALLDFAHAIELAPLDSKSWGERGRFHLARHELEDAKSDLARAIELDQRNIHYRTDLARTRLELGDARAAVADCTWVIESAPAEALAFATRGVARLKIGDSGGAADLERALELEPNAGWAVEARKMLDAARGR